MSGASIWPSISVGPPRPGAGRTNERVKRQGFVVSDVDSIICLPTLEHRSQTIETALIESRSSKHENAFLRPLTSSG